MRKDLIRTLMMGLATAACLEGCGTVKYVTGCGPVARRPNDLPAAEVRINPELAEGQRVYMAHCNQCHVGGAGGVGPSLNDKRIPEFIIRFQIRNGWGAMPAYGPGKISDGQVEDILTYLRYLRRHPNGPVQS